MFVHPGQIQDIIRRHPEINKARVIVTGNIGNEEMTVHCELKNDAKCDLSALETGIAQSTREVTKLRANVRFEAMNSLPADGKLIEDARTYA